MKDGARRVGSRDRQGLEGMDLEGAGPKGGGAEGVGLRAAQGAESRKIGGSSGWRGRPYKTTALFKKIVEVGTF